MTTANECYLSVLEQVKENLQKLKDHVEKHAALQSNEPQNWGFAGDMNHINQLLKAALGDDDE